MLVDATDHKIPGVKLLRFQQFEDFRGELVEVRRRDLELAGIKDSFPLTLFTRSKPGTFRGLHYQVPPFVQSKLVRCVRGVITDYFIDLRVGSPTYLSAGSYLLASVSEAIYLPVGIAHGYKTENGFSHVVYCVSQYQDLGSERAIRPIPQLGMEGKLSKRDSEAPTLSDYATNPIFKFDDL